MSVNVPSTAGQMPSNIPSVCAVEPPVVSPPAGGLCDAEDVRRKEGGAQKEDPPAF